MLNHSELSLDVFWMLLEQEYPAIAQKAMLLLDPVFNFLLVGIWIFTHDNIQAQERMTAVV